VGSLLGSTGVELDVVIVDNGCTVPGLVDDLERADDRTTVVRPPDNLGYAGGCNAGAAVATGDVLVFVNGDAAVEPDAVATLVGALADGVGLVTASVRLADDPATINAAGNPLNILGLVWAGHFGEPAAHHDSRREVAVVSGAAFAVRRETWDLLDGFDPLHFAYHEDTDLSVRCWQQGLSVVYVPEAVVVHRYEFSRNPRKLFLVERNRLLNLMTLWQPRTLLLLLPLLLLFELAMLALAARQGWLHEKVAGYRWLWRHRREVGARRRAVQGGRRLPDRDIARILTPEITAANIDLPPGVGALNAALSAYWSVVRRLL
jgi:GT2 family glycosyltransferase